MVTGSVAPACHHAGIRHPHPHSCSIATVNGKGKDPTTRRVHCRLRSALKVYMIHNGERRYTTDRERDAYEQRRPDWYAPGDDDKRGPPPPPAASWRPHDRPPFTDRDRERFDRKRDRDRDRDMRERDRDRDRDLGGLVPPPPPTRGHWDERD